MQAKTTGQAIVRYRFLEVVGERHPEVLETLRDQVLPLWRPITIEECLVPQKLLLPYRDMRSEVVENLDLVRKIYESFSEDKKQRFFAKLIAEAAESLAGSRTEVFMPVSQLRQRPALLSWICSPVVTVDASTEGWKFDPHVEAQLYHTVKWSPIESSFPEPKLADFRAEMSRWAQINHLTGDDDWCLDA